MLCFLAYSFAISTASAQQNTTDYTIHFKTVSVVPQQQVGDNDCYVYCLAFPSWSINFRRRNHQKFIMSQFNER